MTGISPGNHSDANRHPVTRYALWLFVLCLALIALLAQARHDPALLQERLLASFDSSRLPLLDEWLTTIASIRLQREEAKLVHINNFINSNIVYEEDIAIWGQSDYWATPLETIGQGHGDCEDFAIIKYVSLRMAGIANNKLRLVYAKARLEGLDGPVWVAHMVLAYYTTPSAEPLVLDNLNNTILPASHRQDLRPVFSFNSDGIFAGVSGRGAMTAAAGIGRLSRWEGAWQRILADGYECPEEQPC